MNEAGNGSICNIPSLENEIDFFIRDIDSIHDVLINLVIAFHAASKPVIEKYNKFQSIVKVYRIPFIPLQFHINNLKNIIVYTSSPGGESLKREII